MPRLFLTTLGAIALLLSAPARADVTEVVRPAVTPTTTAPTFEVQTGAAPRQNSWKTRTVFGPQLTAAALSARPPAPAWREASATPADAPGGAPCTNLPRVLPDARAPPA